MVLIPFFKDLLNDPNYSTEGVDHSKVKLVELSGRQIKRYIIEGKYPEVISLLRTLPKQYQIDFLRCEYAGKSLTLEVRLFTASSAYFAANDDLHFDEV